MLFILIVIPDKINEKKTKINIKIKTVRMGKL